MATSQPQSGTLDEILVTGERPGPQDCLEKTIERVETDIEPMRHRANLWSIGDVEGLRALTYADDRITCFNALFSVPKFHAEIGQAVADMYNEWLAAAETLEPKRQQLCRFADLGTAESRRLARQTAGQRLCHQRTVKTSLPAPAGFLRSPVAEGRALPGFPADRRPS